MSTSHPFFYDQAELRACKRRRTQLLRSTGKALVLVPAGSAGHLAPFRAASDFYYLTAMSVAGAVLVLDPLSDQKPIKLFMPPLTERERQWDGARPGLEEATSLFGLDAAFPRADLAGFLEAAMGRYTEVYWVPTVDPQLDYLLMQEWCRRAAPIAVKNGLPAALHDLRPVLAPQRLIKDALEIERLRRAGKLSAAAHRTVIQNIRPGFDERQVHAAIEKAFFDHGGDAIAFPTIAAGGSNTTILHYVANNQPIADDALVLVDAGARLQQYCSDITRTFPIRGRFTAAQRDLYRVVYNAQQAVFKAARPGRSFDLLQKTAVKVLAQGMLDLGILQGTLDEVIEQERFKPFYMHGIGHSLGLDVHDPTPSKLGGKQLAKLEPNIVMTVEPGIYIPSNAPGVPRKFLGIGVRIEDDILIGEQGCEILTDNDTSPEEIEAMMG